MTWPQDAYVGQKVVCVDDNWHNWPSYVTLIGPQLNKIYTILDMKIEYHKYYNKSILGFCLQEVEGRWLAFRFRPVQSTETGMSILKKLLVPTKEFERIG